jgi:hypothetical protein
MAWQRCHVSVSRYQQEAELKDIRAEFPEYAAIHSHVVQDVLAHLDKTYLAFFRRVQRGEKAGFPRFKGGDRFHSFTYKDFSNGARLDNGFLVLAKIGRIAVRWSRPIEGTPKTVAITRDPDGWSVTISCSEGATQALATYRRADRHRPRPGVLCHAGHWGVHRQPAHLSGGGAAPKACTAARLPSQEGQPPQAQGSPPARPSASAGATGAGRLPPQDGARSGARVRRHLS